MKSIRTIALIVASTVVLHASGESFDSLVDRMIALNPGLRSEAYAYAAQRESLRSAAMLPDPEIEGGYMWVAGAWKQDRYYSKPIDGMAGSIQRDAT